MATPYSKRFIAAEIGTSAPAANVAYTVPASKVAIVRQLSWYAYNPATAGGLQWAILVTPGVLTPIPVASANQAAGTLTVAVLHSELHIVLAAGEQLKAFPILGYRCYVQASGYLLDA